MSVCSLRGEIQGNNTHYWKYMGDIFPSCQLEIMLLLKAFIKYD